VSLTSDPIRLYTESSAAYLRLVRFFGYARGIRAYFLNSPLLRSDLRVLDAGCGTGIVTMALRDAMLHRGLHPGAFHGFDITPAMLERFSRLLRTHGLEGVELAEADVLRLETLPESWSGYDLIVSASMLEYLPRESLVAALAGLRSLLGEDGSIVVFISRQNWLTRLLIGRYWKANLYRAPELEDYFRRAGFAGVGFARFPLSVRYLGLWGYIIEARRA
jgi:ubiquinone/menaquinone biosynthesis C-methylase UbiE